MFGVHRGLLDLLLEQLDLLLLRGHEKVVAVFLVEFGVVKF